MVMAGFDRLFGDKPRVHLLEALLRLAPVTFTRAEWAQEAGLQKSSTNRIVEELEKEGFVRRVTDGEHPEYAVTLDNPYVRILNTLEAALELVESHGPTSAVGHDAAEAFRQRAVATVLAANNVSAVEANVQTVRAKPGEGGLTLRRPKMGVRGYHRTRTEQAAVGGKSL